MARSVRHRKVRGFLDGKSRVSPMGEIKREENRESRGWERVAVYLCEVMTTDGREWMFRRKRGWERKTAVSPPPLFRNNINYLLFE